MLALVGSHEILAMLMKTTGVCLETLDITTVQLVLGKLNEMAQSRFELVTVVSWVTNILEVDAEFFALEDTLDAFSEILESNDPSILGDQALKNSLISACQNISARGEFLNQEKETESLNDRSENIMSAQEQDEL